MAPGFVQLSVEDFPGNGILIFCTAADYHSLHSHTRAARATASANSTGERVHMLECARPPRPASPGLADGEAGLPYMRGCATSVNLDSGAGVLEVSGLAQAMESPNAPP